MSLFNTKSCRICLSPNSSFVNVFDRFHGRKIDNLIYQLTKIKLNTSKKLPQSICEHCLSRILLAESIKKICIKNNTFLNNLLEVSPADDADENTKAVMKLEVKMEDSSDNDSLIDHFEHDGFLNEDDEPIQEEPERPITPIEMELIEQPATPESVEEEISWEPFVKLNEESKAKRPNRKKAPSSFFCPTCGLEFPTRTRCLYHERNKHNPVISNERPFTCDRCANTFKEKSHLMNHLNVVHLRVKRYQCSLCGYSSYNKTQHTNHMKVHSNIKEFQCPECKKEFARKETLTVHLRIHTGEKRYRCTFCDRTYSAHTDLKRHLFIHTQTHPYICKLCNEGFFLKRLLFEHVQTVHAGIDTTSWLTGKTMHNFTYC